MQTRVMFDGRVMQFENGCGRVDVGDVSRLVYAPNLERAAKVYKRSFKGALQVPGVTCSKPVRAELVEAIR